jgi:peroxiredoxin Q/BCP
MAQLTPGAEAPSFRLKDQHGSTVSLKDFKGGKLLVYFYPKAMTSGCTKQACNIRDHREDLARLGVDVVGISPDEPERQKQFDDKYGLGFPLLSDPDHAVAEKWGAWGEKSMHGKTYEGVIRSSFLVDDRGRIARAWYKIKPEQTAPEAEKALQEV